MELFKKIFIGVVAILVAFLISFYHIFIIKTLYVWFIYPLINVSISFWYMYGAHMFWVIFSGSYARIPKIKDKAQIVTVFITPTVALLIGYIVKLYFI
jgi:hypothetical protein